VLVVNDKDVVERRKVDVGLLHDGLREVFGTRAVSQSNPNGATTTTDVIVLRPTDRVIDNGLQRVRPDARVSPRTVDMATLMAADWRAVAASQPGR